MRELSVNKFRANLKKSIDQVIDEHEPIKVTRGKGKDFVVMSLEDWEREQETLYILQNRALMSQLAESLETHKADRGYYPTKEQINEINSI